MKANPGGTLAPEDVFGRNSIISGLWERLEKQSIVLSAERRIGKTSIIRKMQAESRGGKLVIFRDLEELKSPIEFAEAVLEDVEQYLSRFQKTARGVRDLLHQVSGAEITGGGVGIKLPSIAASHWKRIINTTFQDLVEHQGEQMQVVVLWDEVPWMLQAIAQREGQPVATEVLDTLRALRQTLPTVRMVFTGSIGLHHVLDAFRDAGYGNAATNDMYVVNVPPLDAENAQSLAEELLKGENVSIESSDSRKTIAAAIAEAVDYIPFYIQHLVVQLKSLRQPVDIRTVQMEVEAALTDSQDQWQLQHYQKRLKIYYGEGEQCQYALNILDALAEANQPLTLNGLVSDLQVRLGKNSDRELARTVLDLLKKDHYLVQSGTQYRFQYRLIQRYWQLTRGLG